MDKQKLLEWIEDLKITPYQTNPAEYFVWYDQALQDVIDAINRGTFDDTK